MSCPLCKEVEAGGGLIVDADTAVSLLDKHPVSPGHCLILPRRHIDSVWELSREDVTALYEVMAETQHIVKSKFEPDGYNIGVNAGEAAGQTVDHLHIHLIPRYLGDDVDPRGGIRWILPERAMHWDD